MLVQHYSSMLNFALQKNSPRKNSRVNLQGMFDDGDRSDESETSSICSEKSYPDYGRRSSDVSSFTTYIRRSFSTE